MQDELGHRACLGTDSSVAKKAETNQGRKIATPRGAIIVSILINLDVVYWLVMFHLLPTVLHVHVLVLYLPGCRGAVAQLLERPSKVPVWYNSTVGSNHAAA